MMIFFDVDTQNDFMHPNGALYVEGSRDIIPTIRMIYDLADAYDIPVMGSMDSHTSNSEEFNKFPEHCVEYTWGWNKIREIDERVTNPIVIDHDHIVEVPHYCPLDHNFFYKKDAIDVRINRNFANHMKVMNVDAVVIFGVVTEFCVKAAALAFRRLGIKTYVVIDAIKGIEERDITSTLAILKNKDVTFILFRDLRELIKKQ